MFFTCSKYSSKVKLSSPFSSYLWKFSSVGHWMDNIPQNSSSHCSISCQESPNTPSLSHIVKASNVKASNAPSSFLTCGMTLLLLLLLLFFPEPSLVLEPPLPPLLLLLLLLL